MREMRKGREKERKKEKAHFKVPAARLQNPSLQVFFFFFKHFAKEEKKTKTHCK
jgi:hypothetical protein